jgi:hypothetical protein
LHLLLKAYRAAIIKLNLENLMVRKGGLSPLKMEGLDCGFLQQFWKFTFKTTETDPSDTSVMP